MSRQTTLGLVVALPGLLLAAVALAVMAIGLRAFEPDAPLTLAEAAALRDSADVVLLVRQGADPNAVAAVRPSVLPSRTGRMTPLDAALTARQVETARVLLGLGATVRADNFERLYCLATRSRIDDLITLITARMPDHDAVDCEALAGR